MGAGQSSSFRTEVPYLLPCCLHRSKAPSVEQEQPRPRPDTRDEALAKSLQEQLNREAQPDAPSTSYRPNTSGLPAGVPPPQHQGGLLSRYTSG